jgi:hypothetical protein
MISRFAVACLVVLVAGCGSTLAVSATGDHIRRPLTAPESRPRGPSASTVSSPSTPVEVPPSTSPTATPPTSVEVSPSTSIPYGSPNLPGPDLTFSGDVSGLEGSLVQDLASGLIPGTSTVLGAAVRCPASSSEIDEGEILGCSVTSTSGMKADLFVKVSDRSSTVFTPDLIESGQSCDQLGTAFWPAANSLGMSCS